MTTVAVLGGGAGGAAATVDLTRRGHAVRWWSRSEGTVAPVRAAGGIAATGVLGAERVRPERVTSHLAVALTGAEAVVVCLPAVAHAGLARALAAAGVAVPVVLNPGHTGGALHVRTVLAAHGATVPPIAELSTLTVVARKPSPDAVHISGVARRVWAACLPGGAAALEAALALFPAARVTADVLATGLANVNLVLHPPGAVLAAAWVEATGGDFRFYVDAMTPGVGRVLEALDAERLAVAAAFGHALPGIAAEMAAIGTAEPEAAARGDVVAAIRGGEANARIRAPDSLAHRYYREDLGYGLLPLLELARVADVELSVAPALLRLGALLAGEDVVAGGLDAARLGIAGLDRDQLLDLVRGPAPVAS